jgi:hypothetical protein
MPTHKTTLSKYSILFALPEIDLALRKSPSKRPSPNPVALVTLETTSWRNRKGGLLNSWGGGEK